MPVDKTWGEKKILVVVDPESRELSPLHHALALAERIRAQVILLRIEPQEESTRSRNWIDDAILELLNHAREAGIAVSFNTLKSRSERAVLGFIREQETDVLVIGEKEVQWGKDLLQMKTGVPGQIIRVREKSEADFSSKVKGS